MLLEGKKRFSALTDSAKSIKCDSLTQVTCPVALSYRVQAGRLAAPKESMPALVPSILGLGWNTNTAQNGTASTVYSGATTRRLAHDHEFFWSADARDTRPVAADASSATARDSRRRRQSDYRREHAATGRCGRGRAD